MNGYELAKQLKIAIPEDLFLIALTGYGQPGDIKTAKEAGFDMHVVKPLDVGPLQTLLGSPQLKP